VVVVAMERLVEYLDCDYLTHPSIHPFVLAFVPLPMRYGSLTVIDHDLSILVV
jgi:hypothetical protein